jgi:hypothetical protein
MLLTVKKQVDETVEAKTPAYYNDWIGNPCYINSHGTMTVVRKTMISIWDNPDSDHYVQQVQDVFSKGTPCTREEFETAYRATLEVIQAAVDGVLINS